ncbi:hypothetical protein TNCV_1525421 [Trichonephila clavipes]|nr:hypothetical protein TNCV_1525421 [Trichonephila clavipes]
MWPPWPHKLKCVHLKRQLGANPLARCCAHGFEPSTTKDPLQSQPSMVCRRKGNSATLIFNQSISTLARNSRQRVGLPRRVRQRNGAAADISTPVALEQCAAKCLEEAVRSFTAMWSRCLPYTLQKV